MLLMDGLESLTTQGRDSLAARLKIAGIKAASYRKMDMIYALYDYLKEPQNIIRIWNQLNPLEKELTEEFIFGEGWLELSDIKSIFKKHNIPLKNNHYFFEGLNKYLDETSPAQLFIIKNKIPSEILPVLKTMVIPTEVSFVPEDIMPEENPDKIIFIGDNFEQNFTNVILLLNQSRLKTTPKNQLPAKSATVKINQALTVKEPLLSGWKDIKDARSTAQTTVIYGMSMLLLNAKLIIANENNELVIGEQAKNFLTSSSVKKCRRLLDTYINSSDINELVRFPELKVRVDDFFPKFTVCRQVILSHLAKMPVNKWVNVVQLLQSVKKHDRRFLIRAVGKIMVYDDYYRNYADRYQEWIEIEGRFIEIALMEYLAVIGIVDVTLMEDETESGTGYFRPEYVKLTPLGAFMLGVSNDYDHSPEESPEDSGFTVQPDFEIIIPEGNNNHIHKLFFDRFAEKMADDRTAVYKLSFKSMIAALDNGIKIKEIIEYLDNYSNHPVPDNVRITLQNWNLSSQKIKIRTVTLIETDSEYLLAELKSYKNINKYILKELTNVCEIDVNDANKIKREIEKKNHFCIV